MERYDYVIVGGGSAGCIAAAELSAEASLRVLLLEAGVENMSARLGTCRSWLADQGVELSLGDAPRLGGDVATALDQVRRRVRRAAGR